MSIGDTRFGYTYQDLQVVSLFIDHYNRHELKEIYSDYEYSRNLSHDIRIVTDEGIEICYEVKTGETVQYNKTQLRRALKEINSFLKDNPRTKYHLLVSEDFGASLTLEIWPALKKIQSPRSSQARRLEGIRTICSYLDMPEGEVVSLFSRLEILNPSPSHRYTSTFCSEIESVIQGKLSTFARDTLGIRSYAAVPPLSMLVLQLCAICEVKSGSRDNLLEPFKESIANFFALTTQDLHVESGAVNTQAEIYKSKMLEFEGLSPAPLGPGPLGATEGDTIS